MSTVSVDGGPLGGFSFNATHDDDCFGPVFDGATLYWADIHPFSGTYSYQEVFSAPVCGSVTSFAYATQFGGPYLRAIAVDAGNVYLLSSSALVRIAK